MVLQKKVAIVTGASRGIGAAIARGFAKEGASLVLCARMKEKLDEVVNEINTGGGRAIGVAADVGNEQDVNTVVNAAIREFGKIDVLVNNAALGDPIGPVCELDCEAWRKMMDVNINGVFYFTRAVAPHMIKQGYGRIQNIGSKFEAMCPSIMAAYSCSKAAVGAMTRAFAGELQQYNILVNTNYPDEVKTDMNPYGTDKPEDVVPTAIYLASLPDDGPTGKVFMYMKEVSPADFLGLRHPQLS